ncbi:MAG: trypsin-like peptidase domain-containing protein [Clostridiales bacterium]|nr:trypsin-like peptidase domain-containing protein [Clostridiales bacterium]
MKQLSISEQLLYSTIQIVCYSNNKTIKSTGTGFIYGACKTDEGCYPILITNKHVVENAEQCELVFHTMDNSDNISNEKVTYIIENNFNKQCIYHPDSTIDLAMFVLGAAFNDLEKNGKKVFYTYLDSSLIPNNTDIDKFSAIEDILMIGYPNGIIDSKNNFPIIRKGITATPYFSDFNGNKQFLADIACYPGSSGSPILFLQEGVSKDKFGNVSIGKSTIKLLGINSSVFLNTITGDLISQSTASIKPLVQVPNNLAIIIKSEKLLEFDNIIKKLANI